MGKMHAEVSKLSKTSDPPVSASQFLQEKDQFWQMASKILNKPKPKVEPPPPAAPEAAKDEKKNAGPASDNKESGNPEPAKENAAPGEMDVD